MSTAAKIQRIKTTERSKLFCDIIGLIASKQWADLRELAEKAEVSAQTLWNWSYGATYNPQINTLVRVAEALGYEITLVRAKRAALRAVR